MNFTILKRKNIQNIIKPLLFLTLCYIAGISSVAQSTRTLPTTEKNNSTVKAQEIKKATKTSAEKSSSTLVNGRFQTRDHFVKTLLPHAVKAGEKLGVDPKVILAQAALETNWGKSILRHADKQPSHNIFAITHTPKHNGKSLTVRTKEFKNGKPYYKNVKFRSYKSFGEAFEDYTRIIQKPHYTKHMKNVQSPLDYATSLQRAGYATDPKYAKKIMLQYHSPVLKNIKY